MGPSWSVGHGQTNNELRLKNDKLGQELWYEDCHTVWHRVKIFCIYDHTKNRIDQPRVHVNLVEEVY